jgi:hypothetical protein
MDLTQQQKAQEFLVKIYTEAWRDESFKKSLINYPIETLNKFTRKIANLPKDKVLIVEDQSNPNHIYINIPAKPNFEDMELNDKQLEAVAGGYFYSVTLYLLSYLANNILDL